MYCFNCGQKIVDDSPFCSNCGTPQNSHTTTITTNIQPESKDLNREAINIYLSNVLALECMRVKLNNDYSNAENELQCEYDNNYIQRYAVSNGYVWLAYHGGKFHVGAFNDGDFSGAYTGEFLNREHMNDGKGFVKYVWGQEIVQHGGRFYWGIIDEQSFPIIKKASFWWDIGGNNILQQKIRQISTKNTFLQLYADFQKNAPTAYRNNLVNVVLPLQDKVEGIDNERKKVSKLLQNAYAINIIPNKFRNSHAIWFIHDFVTTSNETLSSAFLHCDLDEIKKKLDTIIEQQKDIIINQRILMAQNAQMIEQNQQTLNRLANIESNTERASQYAQIAANNAEACAWIGIANYIKD